MTDDWRIAEHSANVALQLAKQWAIAVNAQARRIQKPYSTVERVPDAYLQVVPLHNVLLGAEMARDAELAKDTVASKAAAVAINKAIGAFLAAVVVPDTIDRRDALVDARNAVEHFDEYCAEHRTRRWPHRTAQRQNPTRSPSAPGRTPRIPATGRHAAPPNRPTERPAAIGTAFGQNFDQTHLCITI